MASGIMSFVSNQCYPRIKFGFYTAQESLNTALLLALAGLNGNASLMSSILTGGSKPLTDAAVATEAGLGKSLSKIFQHLIMAINPQAERLRKVALENRGEKFISSPGFFPAHRAPLFLYSLSKKQQEAINFLNNSSWFIHRHFTVRIVAPITSVLTIISAFGTLAVGAFCLPLSIITAGTFPKINTVVYHTLKSVGLIPNQIRQGIIGLYRPALLSSAKPSLEEEQFSAIEGAPAEEESTDSEGQSPEPVSESEAVEQG